MIDTPHIVQSARQRTAAIHVTVPRNEIGQVFPPAVAELLAALREQGIAPAGPLLSYHLKMPGDVFEFEIAVPVEREVKPSERVFASEVPAAKVARTIYAVRWKASARPGASCVTGCPRAGIRPRPSCGSPTWSARMRLRIRQPGKRN
jgi:hypothetical protein